MQFNSRSLLSPSQQPNHLTTNHLRLTFHPLIKQVKDIIFDNLHLLIDDDKVPGVIQTPPLTAYGRDRNIENLIIRTKLPSTTLHSSTTVTKNDIFFHISSLFSCSSACLIYCISCNACGMLYIGETSRQLNARFDVRLCNMEKNV